MNEHTPGPWHYDPEYPAIVAPTAHTPYQDRAVIVVDLHGAMNGQDTKADARLIAAAPTMLTLLKRAADAMQDYRAELDGDHNDSIAMEIYALSKQLEG